MNHILIIKHMLIIIIANSPPLLLSMSLSSCCWPSNSKSYACLNKTLFCPLIVVEVFKFSVFSPYGIFINLITHVYLLDSNCIYLTIYKLFSSPRCIDSWAFGLGRKGNDNHDPTWNRISIFTAKRNYGSYTVLPQVHPLLQKSFLVNMRLQVKYDDHHPLGTL